MTSEQRAATAHHEAGHAIVAAATGARLGQIEIRETADTFGTCEVAFGPNAFARAVVLLAGTSAQSRFLGGVHLASGWSDFEKVATRFFDDGYSAERAREMTTRCEILADSFVDEHWLAIAALARELLIADEVDGARAVEVYENFKNLGASGSVSPAGRPGERTMNDHQCRTDGPRGSRCADCGRSSEKTHILTKSGRLMCEACCPCSAGRSESSFNRQSLQPAVSRFADDRAALAEISRRAEGQFAHHRCIELDRRGGVGRSACSLCGIHTPTPHFETSTSGQERIVCGGCCGGSHHERKAA